MLLARMIERWTFYENVTSNQDLILNRPRSSFQVTVNRFLVANTSASSWKNVVDLIFQVSTLLVDFVAVFRRIALTALTAVTAFTDAQ